jgi:hypothetical protein
MIDLYYKFGKIAAWQDYTWTPERIQQVRQEIHELKADPLKHKSTAEIKGRRAGAIAGLPLTLAGGAAAGWQLPKGLKAALQGLKAPSGAKHLPLAALKHLGVGTASLLGGILAPKATADLGAAVGRNLTDE